MIDTKNRLYEKMQFEKVYVKPGMDSYTEWKEGVNEYKRSMVGSTDHTKKHLDEWAAEFRASVSEVIEAIEMASYMKDRANEDSDVMAEYAEYVMKEGGR